MRRNNWDIFCRVVDNFGDIGFCWRLARQLVAEHGLQVRLWVDDLASLRPLCPDIDTTRVVQTQNGVQVNHWTKTFPAVEIADVVIEAFACELPVSYIAAMAARQDKPAWINLEYLTAENWVTSCHGLASPHPRLALTKHFFFPGFSPVSGGLLREAGLIQQRKAWQADPATGWQHLGLPPAQAEETSISLFCYDNPALPELLAHWIGGSASVRCLIPAGQALVQVARCLKKGSATAGDTFRQGNLTVYALPFLSPEDYDRLLWSCDLNFVRGEDSFVRAQWAAKPFVWQIYPQDNAAHHAKLEAFLERYCAGLTQTEGTACRGFWHAWNQVGESGTSETWPFYWQQRMGLSAHARNWATRLAEAEDLARRLVKFCEILL